MFEPKPAVPSTPVRTVHMCVLITVYNVVYITKARGYVAYVRTYGSVRILFFERYVRTLTYSILAYVNKFVISATGIKSFWCYVKFILIKFHHAIVHYVMDLRKIKNIRFTYLLTYLLR